MSQDARPVVQQPNDAPTRPPGHRRTRRIAVGLCTVATIFLGRHLATLSPRLRPLSRHGLLGLARYTVGEYAGAAEEYRAVLADGAQDVPGDPDDELAYLRGDTARARELALQALERTPDAPRSLLTLAELALDAGALDETIRRTTAVLARTPADTDALVLEAIARARAGDDARAIASLADALGEWSGERRPTTFVRVVAEIGRLYAVDTPRRPNCLLALLHRYLRIHDDDQGRLAIARARDAIANADHADEAWVTIGVIHQKRAEDAEALDAFLHAIEVNPHNAEALRWASIVYADRGDLANQYRMARAAHDAAPGRPLYAVFLGEVLAERVGDYAGAVDVESALLNDGHETATLLGHLGYLMAMLGRVGEAIGYYERALKLNPTDPLLHVELGWALCRGDRSTEGIAAMRRGLALAPWDTRNRLELAVAYRNAGRYDEAIPEFERVYREDPTQRANLPDLCIAYYLAGRFDRARECAGEFLAFARSADVAFLQSFSLASVFEARSAR